MTTLLQILQLAIVGWLPGAAIFRLPWAERERRARLEAEERVFWAVMISLAVSLAIVLALAALHRYTFGRLILADAVVAALGAVVARGRLRLGPGSRPPAWSALIPVLLVALAAWRFFPSAEYIVGGKDPGVYMNEGIQIAQRGALVVGDPVVAGVPPFARNLFFPSHGRTEYYSLRFMGFFIQNPDAGTVVGQFPHLFPASIAIGYGIDGLSGARRTSGVWAILGLLAVYFAGSRLVGIRAAAAAATLLALHVIEVWFAKCPNAEVVMQAFLFAALLANARAHVDGDRFFAPIAGALLGLLLFLRFDVVLGIAGVACGLALGALNGRRPRASFLVTFAVVAAFAATYLLGPMRAYTYLPIVFLSNLPLWEYGVLGLAVAGGLALLLSPRTPRLPASAVQWIPIAMAGAVCVLALYAFVFRHAGGKLAAHDADALRVFTNLYLTLPALVAALLGLVLVSRRAFWRDPALVMTVVVFSCFLFYKIRIVPEHFWMTRRFLPVILPGALLFASAAALGGAWTARSAAGALRALVRVAFIALLASQYGRASRPVVGHVEYAGVIPRLEQIARTFEDDDLVIAEARDTGSDVHVLALPLAYTYARNVLVLNSARPDKQLMAGFLDWARTRYRRVLFMGSGGTDLLSYRYGVRALASDRFQVPEYDAPIDRYPRWVRQKEFDYGVYEFTAAQPVESLWFDLDVGSRDDLHVLRFHAKEQADGRSFRWTGATSYVSVTVIHPSSRDVTLWLNDGGRPPTVAPADVSVYLYGQLLGSARVRGGFLPYSFAIPPDLAARAAAAGDPVELKLVTPTWKPLTVLGTPDERDLGVMVDRVAVR